MVMSRTAKIWTSLIGVIFAMGLLAPVLPILANQEANQVKVKPVTVNLSGTIKKIAVEGICYQLAADDGKKYELMGKFPKIDGTRVQVSGVATTGIATICQVGQPFQVKTVRVIK
jgi:hypothetical protein